jgi:hypothetical protein
MSVIILIRLFTQSALCGGSREIRFVYKAETCIRRDIFLRRGARKAASSFYGKRTLFLKGLCALIVAPVSWVNPAHNVKSLFRRLCLLLGHQCQHSQKPTRFHIRSQLLSLENMWPLLLGCRFQLYKHTVHRSISWVRQQHMLMQLLHTIDGLSRPLRTGSMYS